MIYMSIVLGSEVRLCAMVNCKNNFAITMKKFKRKLFYASQ